MSGNRVRTATLEDVSEIARIHVEAWRSTYRGIVSDEMLANLSVTDREAMWRRAVTREDNRGFVLVAEDGAGHVVGFASGGPETSGHPDYKGELYAIYLLSENQRQGVGRALFEKVVRRLLALGHSSMVMWMLKDNPNRKFAERLGGEEIASKLYEIGEQRLDAVAYGWKVLPVNEGD